ncbi:hypothetical protein OIV83_002706 [Microbotryomycetes sp. JL201]|nr:hypothetical protein OIV83_002706 [Microbotryomycetes sp. JL201]
MPPLLNDLKSLLPSQHPTVAPPLKVGSTAPLLPGEPGFDTSTIVAFVRHCGCPFAEKEVKTLAAEANDAWSGGRELRVVVVTMSSEAVSMEWFDNVGGKDFQHRDRVRLISDPDRTLYGQFGLGTLSFGALFGLETLKSLRGLASEGIVNTATRDGSNRWQNSGGFAIDRGGQIKWVHVAKDASDVSNWQEAKRSLSR